MKTIYKSLIGLILVALVGACQPEFDPGETAAVGFAGEWYYQVQALDGSLYSDFDYAEGYVLLTYNTSADKADEIWIDDQNNWPFYIKSKFTITGTRESFEGTGFSPNEYNIDYYGLPDYPDEDGVQITDTIDFDYVAMELISGEILEGAARVYADKEKAPADSCRFVVAGYGAVLNYVTREVAYREIDTIIEEDTTYKVVPKFVLDRDDPFLEVLEDTGDTIVYVGHRQTGWEVYL